MSFLVVVDDMVVLEELPRTDPAAWALNTHPAKATALRADIDTIILNCLLFCFLCCLTTDGRKKSAVVEFTSPSVVEEEIARNFLDAD